MTQFEILIQELKTLDAENLVHLWIEAKTGRIDFVDKIPVSILDDVDYAMKQLEDYLTKISQPCS